jgi:Zn ribbon nucleic-acid-binding protein
VPGDLVHRDDLDPDELAALAAAFPDMKVVCAGDLPAGQMPPEVRELIGHLKRVADDSLLHGTCVDCGARMPGYPAPGEMADDFRPAEGWCHFTGRADDDFAGWLCPGCDERDRQEGD